MQRWTYLWEYLDESWLVLDLLHHACKLGHIVDINVLSVVHGNHRWDVKRGGLSDGWVA